MAEVGACASGAAAGAVSAYEAAFRPRVEPQRSIYDAFQVEATRRKGRSPEQWQAAEIQAVWKAAVAAAPAYQLTPPTLDMVRDAERYARGSIDYGLQWACALVRTMRQASAGDSAGTSRRGKRGTHR